MLTDMSLQSDDESKHFYDFQKGVNDQEIDSAAKAARGTGKQGLKKAIKFQNSLATCNGAYEANAIDCGPPDKSLNIGKEVDCLNEIKDIRDELKIISSVFNDQRFVLGELQREASRTQPAPLENENCLHSNFVSELPEYHDWETRCEMVKKMEDDAESVYIRVSVLPRPRPLLSFLPLTTSDS